MAHICDVEDWKDVPLENSSCRVYLLPFVKVLMGIFMLTFFLSSREEPSKTDYDDASWDMGNMKISDKKKSYDEDSYQSPSNNKNQSYSKKTEIAASSGDDAQKKFGNAKSISSDMYFGNSSSGSDVSQKGFEDIDLAEITMLNIGHCLLF